MKHSIVINQSLSVSKQTKTKSINSMKGKKTKITLKKRITKFGSQKKWKSFFNTKTFTFYILSPKI